MDVELVQSGLDDHTFMNRKLMNPNQTKYFFDIFFWLIKNFTIDDVDITLVYNGTTIELEDLIRFYDNPLNDIPIEYFCLTFKNVDHATAFKLRWLS